MAVERNRDGIGCVSCGKSGHAATHCPNLNEYFPSMQPGWRRGLRGVHYDPTSGVARPTADGKRRLIRGEGFASQVSGTVRPQDTGGGETTVAAPRLMKTDNISDTTELLRGGGGGAPVVPSRISVVLVEKTAPPHFLGEKTQKPHTEKKRYQNRTTLNTLTQGEIFCS